MEKEVNKKSVTLTKFEDIRDFLEGNFRSPITYYNSFITMEHFGLWNKRLFSVYCYVDKEIESPGKIIRGMIHILSEKDLPVKKGVCEFVKQYNDKAVYKIKVVEIEKIVLEEIEIN